MRARKNKNANIMVLMILALIFLLFFLYSFFSLSNNYHIFGILPARIENILLMALSFLGIIKTIADIISIEH
jgi:hypothetical protein